MEDQTAPVPISPRERFRDYMAGEPVDRPPLLESQIPMETAIAWCRQGLPRDILPHGYFGLDEQERVPIRTSRVDLGVKPVTDMRSARVAAGRYFSDVLKQFPPAWPRVRQSLLESRKAVYAEVYPRGFFQEMGIKDSPTLDAVLTGLHDEPKAAEFTMAKYTDFLVEVIRSRYRGLDIQYFLYSEPIAHTESPVISPDMYRRFVMPYLTRLVYAGRKIGVHEHVMWTSGNVQSLIPIWVEAGINGLWIGHASAVGVDYRKLRQEYGSEVSLWGGMDNRALHQGPKAIEAAVARIAPLFSSGRYIAMVDDTIRPGVPFEAYACYRDRLRSVLPSG